MSATLVKVMILLVWAFFLAAALRQVPVSAQYHQLAAHAQSVFSALSSDISTIVGR